MTEEKENNDKGFNQGDNSKEENKGTVASKLSNGDANKQNMKDIPSTIWNYLVGIFSFNQDGDVNPNDVSEAIKKSIEFRGHNVWVLICSIFIASIGLNVNSIPVVIGAMLISPLMGPIRGVGLAVGTNNFKLLIFSLVNFGVATGVSIIASFIYFKLTPFKTVTPEILGRTEPFFLDVLIASFGGLAGIIAASKNDNSTVVPGVAIATALMPPLCVAGYGLATGHWSYFLGASYLFLLNSIFICLTTIVVIRYLKFPLVSYVNTKTERKIKIYIAAFLLVILIPSGIKFASIWKKSVFTSNVELFINNEIAPIAEAKNLSVVQKKIVYEPNQQLTLSIVGDGYIDANRIIELQNKLKEELPFCSLKIIQDKIDENAITPELYYKTVDNYVNLLDKKEIQIKELEAKIEAKPGYQLVLDKTMERLKLNPLFDKIYAFSAANAYKLTANNTVDTLLLFQAEWQDTSLNANRTAKLKQFIQVEFSNSPYELIETLHQNE